MRRIRVAVPVPGLDALTYALPGDLASPAVGARALVPLGTRVVTGVVVGEEPPEVAGAIAARGGTLREVIDILDDGSFLPPDVVSLALWVAEYYACGAGEALAAAMPPRTWVESERHVLITASGLDKLSVESGLRRSILERLADRRPARADAVLEAARGGSAALQGLERDGLVEISRPLAGSASAFRTVRTAHVTAQGLDVHASHGSGTPEGAGAALGPRQREALALLAGAPEGVPTPDLAERGISPATVKRLAALGLVTFTRRRVDRDPFTHAASAASGGGAPPPSLTGEQESAMARLRALADASAFATVVLHGVTGSGKTEVYLRLADHVARSGRAVLILVPEIALTPAVAGAFRARFGEQVAIQHSGLSDGERHDQWHRIRAGSVSIVVGTRSAVFAPLGRLGLIVVDEEHDGSYKQEESPRYHGRDVAVMRGRALQALVVLGSATPSLESYHNAETGRYTLVALERRVHDRPLARVRLVDMRDEYARHGPDVIVSAPLAEAIGARLERGEQAMVLLNRRGYATSMFCRSCGAALECPNCSVTLTIHRAARRARCHYCNYASRIPAACGACAGAFMEQAGFGTERVEAEIAAAFPHARVARVDRDTVRRRGAITALLDRFREGTIDVLVGTQMIAKGHDFPRVTLVGVISADVGLGLADFRAGERTFHLLTQVAGRAGRGDMAGEAVVQTIHPGHYSIRHACRQDYPAFYQEEVRFRRSMRYPPAVSMINAIVKAPTLDAAMNDAREVAAALIWGGEAYRVLGPAPAPLSRLKGEHRAQLFLKGTYRTAMRKALLGVLDARPDIKRRTTVDVDPVSVL